MTTAPQQASICTWDLSFCLLVWQKYIFLCLLIYIATIAHNNIQSYSCLHQLCGLQKYIFLYLLLYITTIAHSNIQFANDNVQLLGKPVYRSQRWLRHGDSLVYCSSLSVPCLVSTLWSLYDNNTSFVFAYLYIHPNTIMLCSCLLVV